MTFIPCGVEDLIVLHIIFHPVFTPALLVGLHNAERRSSWHLRFVIIGDVLRWSLHVLILRNKWLGIAALNLFHFWGRARCMALGNPADRVIKKKKRLLHDLGLRLLA